MIVYGLIDKFCEDGPKTVVATENFEGMKQFITINYQRICDEMKTFWNLKNTSYIKYMWFLDNLNFKSISKWFSYRFLEGQFLAFYSGATIHDFDIATDAETLRHSYKHHKYNSEISG